MPKARRIQVSHRSTAPIDLSHEVPEWCQPFKEGLSFDPSDSRAVVVEQPVVAPKETTPDDTRVSSEEESTDLPFVAERFQRPNTSKQSGSTMFLHIFPKIRSVRYPSSVQERPDARGDRIHLPQNKW